MAVDIVVVSYNTLDLLRECLTSIRTSSAEADGITGIVVDNASTDGSVEMVRTEFTDMRLVALDANIGFGPANNRGIGAGSAACILLLNADAQLTPGALAAMAAVLDADPKCIAVGPKLIYPDGRFHPSCRRFPTVMRNLWNTAGMQDRFKTRFAGMRNWLREHEHVSGGRVDMVSGACALVRRDYLESIGCFDENMFLYEEEMDIFLPANRRGLEVRWCGDATVIHHHGASSGEHQESEFALKHQYRSRYYCFRKHYGAWSARLAYWSDLGVYSLSTALNRLRGKPSSAALHRSLVREAYRTSLSLRCPTA
ncbi:MAG: glycosyltransferase family 2 protein [Candidatus Hydrogenedentes bacterium]|nr:glycosyltransferase family 2 protein [Candidatus Hydrogenedentota bacterium]